MKTSLSRAETQLSFALPACTPLVENSDPAGVALGGNDGQGVCTLPPAIQSAVADFRLDREAVDLAWSLASGLSPAALRLHTLARMQFCRSVSALRTCGYLLFLH